jgi:hypothetical protein
MLLVTPELDDSLAANASLSSLAEHLRDGPLHELIELQRQTTEIAHRAGATRADRLRDLEQLVRLSLSAMEQFHAFTREFQTVLRELTDASNDHH